MASQGELLHKNVREALRIILQVKTGKFFDSVRTANLRKKTKPEYKASSGQAQKGDTKMHDYQFRYLGGAKKIEQANIKFHIFLADSGASEHHLYGSLKNGLVEHRDLSTYTYASATPIIKVFTSTAGFGIPKEYFSYFIVLSPSASKVINIKPLGYKKLGTRNWFFSGRGRFMVKQEVAKFFGTDSDTWRFYSRQSFLSRHRLQELVSISDEEFTKEPAIEQDEVRLLRFD